jgi:hypothetical protein
MEDGPIPIDTNGCGDGTDDHTYQSCYLLPPINPTVTTQPTFNPADALFVRMISYNESAEYCGAEDIVTGSVMALNTCIDDFMMYTIDPDDNSIVRQDLYDIDNGCKGQPNSTLTFNVGCTVSYEITQVDLIPAYTGEWPTSGWVERFVKSYIYI